jgi:hypothetical protein
MIGLKKIEKIEKKKETFWKLTSKYKTSTRTPQSNISFTIVKYFYFILFFNIVFIKNSETNSEIS